MKNATYIFLCISLILVACQSDSSPSSNWKPLDLLSHGVPITVMAPDSTKVAVDDFLGLKDITLKGEDNYSVQLFAYDATTTKPAEVKSKKLAEVQQKEYFTKIIKDFPDGFIYETVVDSTFKSYRFMHFKIKGDVEYILQSGLYGKFTLEEAEATYQAVANPKK